MFWISPVPDGYHLAKQDITRDSGYHKKKDLQSQVLFLLSDVIFVRSVKQPIDERAEWQVGEEHHREHYRAYNHLGIVYRCAEPEEADEYAHDWELDKQHSSVEYGQFKVEVRSHALCRIDEIDDRRHDAERRAYEKDGQEVGIRYCFEK